MLEELGAGVGVPSTVASAAKVTNVTASARHCSDYVWISKAFIERDAIEGNDGVVLGVQDEGRHCNSFNPIKATSLVVVLYNALKLRMHLNREMLIQLPPRLDFVEFL